MYSLTLQFNFCYTDLRADSICMHQRFQACQTKKRLSKIEPKIIKMCFLYILINYSGAVTPFHSWSCDFSLSFSKTA